jgi:hypothetical protein
MLELVLTLVFVAALIGAAGYAFWKPNGIYWRSAAGAGIAALAGAVVWQLASGSISNEAGLGAFVIWLAVCIGALLIAASACFAATLRHLLNALGARIMQH